LHGVFPQAFSLREKAGVKEDYLSAAWLEIHDGDRYQQVMAVKAEFREARDVRPRDAFVLGTVIAIKGVCSNFGCKLRVSHEPAPKLNSHVAVRRYRDEPIELLEALATSAWSELQLGLHG
jgi:hypothetical protein